MNKSSCVRDVLKCGDNLLVEFHGDKCFEYAGAGSHEQALRTAASPGAYFNANIRGKFAATKF